MTRKIALADPDVPFFGALDADPTFAAQIGILMACFGLLESRIPAVFSLLTGLPKNESFIIMGSFTSFSHRIDLLQSIASERAKANDDAAIILKFCGAFRYANRLRNKYAHGKYSGGRNCIILETFANDARRVGGRYELTIEDIAPEVNWIKMLYYFVWGFLEHDEMPPESFWQDLESFA